MPVEARLRDIETEGTALVIRRVDAVPVALPLAKPMRMAGEAIERARNLLVRIEARDGTVGWGEAASAPTMTGDTLDGLVAAVRDHLAPLLVGRDARLRPELMRTMRRALFGNGGAHSAVEMALLDLAGRAWGRPLIDLIGGAMRGAVAPMWLLGNATAEEDIAEAQTRRREGFDFFKLKVGTKPVATEIAAALALRRTLGPEVRLCADANTGFVLADARRYLESTREAGLLFLEQPLGHDDLDGMAALAAAAPVAIGADEGIHNLADIEAHAARRAAAGLSLKLIKLGGISACLRAAALCELRSLSVNLATKVAESSIGSAAMVHVGCAIPVADWGVSLTHFYLAEDVVEEPLRLDAGGVALPAGPGLGVVVDEAAIERCRLR